MLMVRSSTCAKCSNTIELFRFSGVLKKKALNRRCSIGKIDLQPGLVYHTWLGIHLWLWPRKLSLEWERERRSARCSNAASYSPATHTFDSSRHYRRNLSEKSERVSEGFSFSLAERNRPESFIDYSDSPCETTYFYYSGISTSFSRPLGLNNIWRPWEVCERKRKKTLLSEILLQTGTCMHMSIISLFPSRLLPG